MKFSFVNHNINLFYFPFTKLKYFLFLEPDHAEFLTEGCIYGKSLSYTYGGTEMVMGTLDFPLTFILGHRGKKTFFEFSVRRNFVSPEMTSLLLLLFVSTVRKLWTKFTAQFRKVLWPTSL